MNILVADDDFVIRGILQNNLEKMGYTVLTAEDGLQAWNIFQNENLKMVISDWLMPQMDGLDLCRKIRSAHREHYTYVIILTAKNLKEDLVKVFESGADDYISKPFYQGELEARLKTAERILNLEDEYIKFNNILIESRNKFRIVFDSLQEKIIVVDEDFIILSANKAFMETSNKGFHKIIGRSFLDDEFDIHKKGCVVEVKSKMMEVFQSGKPIESFHAYTEDNGQNLYTHFNYLPIKKRNGDVFQVVVVEKDITEERRKSEEIKFLNTELTEALDQINSKNKALETTLEELKNTQAHIVQSEKLASIGQLAAGVAHEINNPTGFVSSNLKTLADYQNDMKELIKSYRKLITYMDNPSSESISAEVLKEMVQIKTIEDEIDIDFIQTDIQDLLNDCHEGTERIKNIVSALKDFAHPGDGEIKIADINKVSNRR
jgi:PAS domain S-box-containing protein